LDERFAERPDYLVLVLSSELAHLDRVVHLVGGEHLEGVYVGARGELESCGGALQVEHLLPDDLESGIGLEGEYFFW